MKPTNNSQIKGWLTGLLIAVFACLGSDTAAFSQDDGYRMTGLPELTQEDIEWQNTHMLRVKKVKINQRGLERINQYRQKRAQRKMTDKDVSVVPLGKEIEGVVGAPKDDSVISSDSSTTTMPAALPPYVDNSALKFFPPIRSQGSLPSCGAFSGTYYAMTYMNAMARDLDAKTGGESLQLSPKWTYNMINGGALVGSWYYQAYDIGIKHGVSTWAQFPYDSNYRQWNTNATVWRDAVYRRFDQYGYVANTHLDSGIEQVKQLLLNGYVLNFPTYISSWQYKTIGNDPATSADDAFVGKRICHWVNGTSGYHAMTVVGYNDEIWVDINGNGTVDSGEKGAFRIANSWGTSWGEAGFAWMAYDALKNPSAVSGGPATNRIYGWSPSRAHWVTARSSYTPTLIAEFTLSHAQRNQLRVTLGVSGTTGVSPSQIWYPKMIYGQGGAYAFNGTTTACDGTFVFDFSDIVPLGGDPMRYYLGVYDSVTGNSVTVKSYRILDIINADKDVVCGTVPVTGDYEQLYKFVEYNFNDGNEAPVAIAQATPVSGTAPLTVTFDASGSYDPDGNIVSYAWDFGDGTSGTGVTVQHTYTASANYEATLQVTDNGTSTNEDWLTIQVAADTNQVIFVDDINLSAKVVKKRINVQSDVLIRDVGNLPMENATVTGAWSGLVSGSVSGVTDATGKVSFTSPTATKAGTIIFQVTNVSKSAYTYDATLNKETQDSISVAPARR
ncbi:MAG: PKD domain-containing protein [Desulfobacterales bacterium]|jgi:C1A family cysteine protease/PKD repeat protein|nr:PKD domain-containing protein [Desulfobacterales bacterium]